MVGEAAHPARARLPRGTWGNPGSGAKLGLELEPAARAR